VSDFRAHTQENRFMSRFLRHAPQWAAASILILAAGAASAQSDDSTGETPGGNSGDTATPSGPSALPGVILQRDVYVPVDGTGHPTSNQYIVVERRVIPRKEGGAGDASGESGGDAGKEVPTRFILVPQESDDEQEGNDEHSDEPGATPQ
jgi:hypothetical protein